MLSVGKKEKLGAYLKWWIAQRPANRTSRGYAQIIENHITPVLGRITLDKLSPTHIDGMLNALRGELSDTTRHHIRAVLSVSLAYAERKNLVARNVARLAEPITMSTYKSVYLDVAQASALLDAAKGHRLEALFTLAVYLGMRQGELLGLRWKDAHLLILSDRIRLRGCQMGPIGHEAPHLARALWLRHRARRSAVRATAARRCSRGGGPAPGLPR